MSHAAIAACLADLTSVFVVSTLLSYLLWVVAGRYLSADTLELMLGFV